MEEIVVSISRVTNIMGEIASAMREQVIGIDQINQAVAHMDEVTQQNVSLVDDAVAQSNAVEKQAEQLAEVVSVFRLHAIQEQAIKASAKTHANTMYGTPSFSRPKAPVKALSKPAAAKTVQTSAKKQSDSAGWEEF